MNQQRLGPLAILLSATLWSFGGILGKLIPFSGLSIACIRGVIAAIVIALYRKSFRIKLTPAVFWAGLCLSFTTLLYMSSNKLTTAANAIVLQYTSPIFIILLSWIFLKQKPKKLDLFALVGVFAGITLFFSSSLSGGHLLGDSLAILSGLFFAGVFFANTLPGANPLDAVYFGNALSLVLFPFVFMDKAILAPSLIPWFLIAVMGIFQLGIGYLVFAYGIKHVSATTASILATLEPILNPIWVFLILGEKPSVTALLGGLLVLVTVLTYNLQLTKSKGL